MPMIARRRSKRRRSPSRRLSHQYFLALRLKRGELTAFIDRLAMPCSGQSSYRVRMDHRTETLHLKISRRGYQLVIIARADPKSARYSAFKARTGGGGMTRVRVRVVSATPTLFHRSG